ncbi:MAG: GIY-YIG nuclease family protein [Acidobacteria bacterium]|nr:GIY-YIG nuclease family protein [Acidobacteriota bacterium]
MPFSLYILRSTSTGKFYVGHSEHPARRVTEHNYNRSAWTRNRGPWELVYTEKFATRWEASRRERTVKKMKSHAWIEELARASRSDREGR